MGHRLVGFARAWPVTAYVVAGAILFLLSSGFVRYGREPIVIDAGTMAGELERRADEAGRDLSSEEREEAIQRFVDEEILIREAHRRGLHLRTSRARERLLRRMRSALSQGIPQPSRAQLRAYFGTTADRYQMNEAISFVHVFFSDPTSAPADAEVLEALTRGADPRGFGEPYWLGSVLQQVPRDRLAAAMGNGFTEDVFALAPGLWSGPMASNRGIHFVQVLDRIPSAIPEFELVEGVVRFDWVSDKRIDIVDRRLGRIQARYEVERPR